MNFNNYFYLSRYALAKKRAVEAYKNAIKNQSLKKEDLDALSWIKTQNLLRYAYKNVPWYTEKFNSINLNPNDISKPAYFKQIPILTRQDILENFEKFIANGKKIKDLNLITTGGSSGTPLKI
jgi:phenylacetate-CoA ligase